MDFETFKENLVNDVKEKYYERTGEDVQVDTRKIEKMNETYDAITIKPEDGVIGVNINATSLYKDYEEGRPYDAIVNGAADVADNALRNSPEFDVDAFSDYGKMKDTLAMEVVSKDRNADLLESVPHKDIDRKKLKNPNGLILGTPGSGKSFAAKREIVNSFLVTDDDIIISDPEQEYKALVDYLGGQVIRISPTSTQYVNPMDINMNYSDDDNPVMLKVDFILSLCELIMGSKGGLQPAQKTVIDRCVRRML